MDYKFYFCRTNENVPVCDNPTWVNIKNMKKIIGKVLLRMMGWKVEVEGDLKELDRCIMIGAPHTSN